MSETTREERRKNVRQRILQTALALINEKGLEKLSLREIARRVEYSPAGLYEYFDGKDDILRALAREADGRLYAAFDAIAHDLPPKERLIQMCLVYVDFVLSSSAYFVVMDAVSSSYTSFEQPIPAESSYSLFVQAVQTAIEHGEITPRDAFNRNDIIYALYALMHGMGTLRLTRLRDFKADFASASRRAVEALLDGWK